MQPSSVTSILPRTSTLPSPYVSPAKEKHQGVTTIKVDVKTNHKDTQEMAKMKETKLRSQPSKADLRRV